MDKKDLLRTSTVRASLGPAGTKAVRDIAALSSSMGITSFIVGGTVRDMIMGRTCEDLDIAVHGDAVPLAVALARRWGTEATVHKRFGTVTIFIGKGRAGKCPGRSRGSRVDFAATRTEKYRSPAALPVVTAGTLEQDLIRRDFTINAMALAVNGEKKGGLVDPAGGLNDIHRQVIRVLHDKSFIDDPTRIFRAVRFERRLGFKIEKRTLELIREACHGGMINRVGRQRIRNELILCLMEKYPARVLKRVEELAGSGVVCRGFRMPDDIDKTFRRLKTVREWYERVCPEKEDLRTWFMFLILLLEHVPDGRYGEAVGDLSLTRAVSDDLLAYREIAGKVLKELSSQERISPSRVYSLLEPLSHEMILCLMSRPIASRAKARIRKYLSGYCVVRSEVTARDLEAEGIMPGPGYGRIKDRLLYSRLDGEVRSRRSELDLLKRIAGGSGHESGDNKRRPQNKG